MENDDLQQLKHDDTYYPSVIMSNIKSFYENIAKPDSDERNEKVIHELNKMNWMIRIFEEPENIKKEFKELKEWLDGRTTITFDEFDEFCHRDAVSCQRTWHKKGQLLTPVPYKEDIKKDVIEEWKKKYPELYKDEESS